MTNAWRRVGALLAIFGLTVSACGGDDEAAPPSSSTTSTTLLVPVAPPSSDTCTGREPAAAADLELELDPVGVLVRGQISWSLTLTNHGDDAVELVFPSGQDGDVVLRDENGRESYRWSSNLSFTQALRCQVVPPGRAARYALGGVLRARPGRYTAIATVAARPRVLPARGEVTVSS